MTYRPNAQMLECKLHPGLHVGGGQTRSQAFTKFLASMGYHFFLRIVLRYQNDE